MFASLSSSCHHVFFRFNLSFLHQFMWFMYVHVRFSPFQVILAFLLSTFSVVSRNSRWRRWLSCKMLRNSARQSPQGSGIFWWHDPCFRRTLQMIKYFYIFFDSVSVFSRQIHSFHRNWRSAPADPEIWKQRSLEFVTRGVCESKVSAIGSPSPSRPVSGQEVSQYAHQGTLFDNAKHLRKCFCF